MSTVIGKECHCGPRRFSLSAPSAREVATLSVGLEALPGFQTAVGRGRQDTAGLCAAGIRRLPEVWPIGTRISPGKVPNLPRGTPGRVQLQASRGFCPSCGARRMADDCMDAGGRAKQEPEPRVQPCW